MQTKSKSKLNSNIESANSNTEFKLLAGCKVIFCFCFGFLRVLRVSA